MAKLHDLKAELSKKEKAFDQNAIAGTGSKKRNAVGKTKGKQKLGSHLAATNVFRVVRPRGLSFDTTPRVEIKCDKCGLKAQGAKGMAGSPVGVVAEIFRHKGFEVDAEGRTAVCKACRQGPKSQSSANGSGPHEPSPAPVPPAAPTQQPIQPPAPPPAEPPLPPAAADPMLASRAAIRQQFAAMRLIDTHFVSANGRYAPGWSDARVSEETGVSRQVIISMRETEYGPLKTDPAIADLQAEIARFEEQIKSDLGGLEILLAEIRKEAAAVVLDLRGKIKALLS